MLILDGYGSHYALNFINVCKRHKILPFCLPAHTTNLLQSLDVVLFCSYKKGHHNILRVATYLCCQNFNKVEFLFALKICASEHSVK